MSNTPPSPTKTPYDVNQDTKRIAIAKEIVAKNKAEDEKTNRVHAIIQEAVREAMKRHAERSEGGNAAVQDRVHGIIQEAMEKHAESSEGKDDSVQDRVHGIIQEAVNKAMKKRAERNEGGEASVQDRKE